ADRVFGGGSPAPRRRRRRVARAARGLRPPRFFPRRRPLGLSEDGAGGAGAAARAAWRWRPYPPRADALRRRGQDAADAQLLGGGHAGKGRGADRAVRRRRRGVSDGRGGGPFFSRGAESEGALRLPRRRARALRPPRGLGKAGPRALGAEGRAV